MLFRYGAAAGNGSQKCEWSLGFTVGRVAWQELVGLSVYRMAVVIVKYVHVYHLPP